MTSRRPMMHRLRLGEMLIDRGSVSEQQLVESLLRLEKMSDPRPRIGSFLASEGYVTDEDVASAVAAQFGFPYFDPRRSPIQLGLVESIPRRFAENQQCVPVERDVEGVLTVAVADPTNLIAIDHLRSVAGASELKIVVSSPKAIRETIYTLYPAEDESDQSQTITLGEYPQNGDSGEDDAPAVTLVNRIISGAFSQTATDIHVEPEVDCLMVRYRIDGILREAFKLPRELSRPLISRIKILSGMDISEHRRPLDGRGRFKMGRLNLDYRVSTIPQVWGEKAVIRLLPTGDDLVSLEGLGMEPIERALLEGFLDMAQGMIIFTGPTGSGKTTAMYAALQRIERHKKNIVTLEDPIEYQLRGTTQVQVEERAGLTFARGLRAILRQDPDVILLGEIRDEDTARMAVQAAMTGHLVLTTLHTNDAPSAVARLIDMGVEPFLVSASVSLVIGQRLIRRICNHCRAPAVPSQSVRNALMLRDDQERSGLLAGVGCEECDMTGYKGRLGVFEVFALSQRANEAIMIRPTPASLARVAREEGMTTLRDDALRKAFRGETTLEEVLRISQALGHPRSGESPFSVPMGAAPSKLPDNVTELVVKLHPHPLLEGEAAG